MEEEYPLTNHPFWWGAFINAMVRIILLPGIILMLAVLIVPMVLIGFWLHSAVKMRTQPDIPTYGLMFMTMYLNFWRAHIGSIYTENAAFVPSVVGMQPASDAQVEYLFIY